jgi:hypothetical protein
MLSFPWLDRTVAILSIWSTHLPIFTPIKTFASIHITFTLTVSHDVTVSIQSAIAVQRRTV